jgi:hypothetical protein
MNDHIKKSLEEHSEAFKTYEKNLKELQEKLLEWELIPKDGVVP